LSGIVSLIHLNAVESKIKGGGSVDLKVKVEKEAEPYLDVFFTAEIREALEKILNSQKTDSIRSQGMAILKNFCLGSHDAVWLSYL